MLTFFPIQLSRKVARSLFLAALAVGAVLLSMLAFLYQKTITSFSSRGVASLQAPTSCVVPTQGPTTNEHKQLFVSCAGFLD